MRSTALLSIVSCWIIVAFAIDAVAQTDTRRARAAQMDNARTGISTMQARGAAPAEMARNAPRIINGDPVSQQDRDWAWAVSLQRDGRHICGGSLVSPNIRNGVLIGWRDDHKEATWAVTAAHCVTDNAGQAEAATRFLATSGNVSLISPDRVAQKVVTIAVHEDYDPVTFRNDIALLKLESVDSIPDGARRTSIPLADPLDRIWLYQDYAALTVAGWGRTEDSFMSEILERVLVPYVDRSTCQEAYDDYGASIEPGMFCAGYSTGGYDSCQGDSGGSVFFRPARAFGDPADRPLLAGVVSWGIGCALNGLYGVYTNVLAFRTWLERTVLKAEQG